jgi:hypothetical protein
MAGLRVVKVHAEDGLARVGCPQRQGARSHVGEFLQSFSHSICVSCTI